MARAVNDLGQFIFTTKPFLRCSTGTMSTISYSISSEIWLQMWLLYFIWIFHNSCRLLVIDCLNSSGLLPRHSYSEMTVPVSSTIDEIGKIDLSGVITKQHKIQILCVNPVISIYIFKTHTKQRVMSYSRSYLVTRQIWTCGESEMNIDVELYNACQSVLIFYHGISVWWY